MRTKYLYDVVQSLVSLPLYGVFIDVCSLKQEKHTIGNDVDAGRGEGGETNDSNENILYFHSISQLNYFVYNNSFVIYLDHF